MAKYRQKTPNTLHICPKWDGRFPSSLRSWSSSPSGNSTHRCCDAAQGSGDAAYSDFHMIKQIGDYSGPQIPQRLFGKKSSQSPNPFLYHLYHDFDK